MSDMDQRMFGPYYGTPPEQHTHDPRTVAALQQPVQPELVAPPTWASLMQRLMTRRKPRTPKTAETNPPQPMERKCRR